MAIPDDDSLVAVGVNALLAPLRLAGFQVSITGRFCPSTEGYANEVVAAKCWCFLFVVADWILDKTSEDVRRVRFDDESRTLSWTELSKKLAANERTKAAVNAWHPRPIDPGYLKALNDGGVPEANSPESVAVEFLLLWARRNFGGMSRLCWARDCPGSGAHAGELRELLGARRFKDFRLEAVEDDAPAIAVVRATLEAGEPSSASCTIRLIYETPDGDVSVAGLPHGNWRIIGARID